MGTGRSFATESGMRIFVRGGGGLSSNIPAHRAWPHAGPSLESATEAGPDFLSEEELSPEDPQVEAARLDAMLDEALAQTFPASDPPAIQCAPRSPRQASVAAPHIRKDATGRIEQVAERVIASLQAEGFGILTRVDLQWPRAVILGACEPALTYEAYRLEQDLRELLPCHVIVLEMSEDRVTIEFAAPVSVRKNSGGDRRRELERRASAKISRAADRV